MKHVFGYIRVSDPKQGKGVSLQEQREAIQRHADKHDLSIVEWFEEQRTAAKRGRPVFTTMMKQLAQKKVAGVIMHKIDRSARNLRDWADLAELSDRGIELHFAHESLDMSARGGRLAADIQAVVAADYIRNLRQEALKGIRGRLKQGLYPFGAPIGYLNNGGGNVKTIDPIQGPLVSILFELYSTGNYSLNTLVNKMYDLGLRNRRSRKVNASGLSVILNNTFYIGLMEVKGQTYDGIHKPLVTPSLFQKVHQVLAGKLAKGSTKHDHLFRKLIKCHHCGSTLVGENQKERVYYRCHTKGCISKTIREDQVEHFINTHFSLASLSENEAQELDRLQQTDQQVEQKNTTDLIKSIRLNLSQTDTRCERLVDAFIDGTIDQETYNNRNEKLLIQKKQFQEKLGEIKRGNLPVSSKLTRHLELCKSLKNSYSKANSDLKRELLKIVTSNFSVSGRKLMFSMKSPFLELENRHSIRLGGLKRGGGRQMNSRFVDVNNYTPPDKREMTKREIKEFYKFLKNMVLAEIQKEKEERDKRKYGQAV